MNSEILAEETKILSENWVTNIVASFGKPSDYSIVSPSKLDINNRLWDLASVTKIYSLITILSLCEIGEFDITKKVKDYSTNFPNLSDLFIYQLMNFSVELSTDSRIDKCKTYESAVSVLHNTRIKSNKPTYSDLGVMIVVQILNELHHSDDYFKDYTYKILNKAKATNTHWWKDIDPKETNIENYDSEFRYVDGKLEVIRTPLRMCHDPKARIIPYTGHAGLFSSASDVALFASALLNENIISRKTILRNLNDKYDCWDKTHHWNLLCNEKHPDIIFSEVPASCSLNSISMSGFSGCHLLLDFDNRFFVFLGSNRINKRITNLPHDNTTYDYPCTKDWVYRKDSIVKMIAYKLLS